MKRLRRIVAFAMASALVGGSAVAQERSLVTDADRVAYHWAQSHRTGISVAVRVGQDSLVPIERVEHVLRADFAKHGHKGPIVFFYEQGGSGETTVRYLTGNHVWGPFALEMARDNVEDVVDQLNFEIGQGLN